MVSEVETVEVYEVAEPRRAPVEFIGRLTHDGSPRVDATRLAVGDWLIARPSQDSPWRTGRASVVRGLGVNWSWIVAIADGDYVYRIGKPLTPSLEERMAELERRVYPDLIVADDAAKDGRPEVAAKLRAKVEWWRDPDIDWTGIER